MGNKSGSSMPRLSGFPILTDKNGFNCRFNYFNAFLKTGLQIMWWLVTSEYATLGSSAFSIHGFVQFGRYRFCSYLLAVEAERVPLLEL